MSLHACCVLYRKKAVCPLMLDDILLLACPKWQASKHELFSLAATSPAKALWGNAPVNDLPILYSWSGRPLQIHGMWQVFRVHNERVDKGSWLPVQAWLCQPGWTALQEPVWAGAPSLPQWGEMWAGSRKRSCLQVNRWMHSVNSPVRYANKTKPWHSGAVSHTANTLLSIKSLTIDKSISAC